MASQSLCVREEAALPRGFVRPHVVRGNFLSLARKSGWPEKIFRPRYP